MNKKFIENLTLFRQNITAKLFAERNATGTWQGELSSSALATAVAIVSLQKFDKQKYQNIVSLSYNWLVDNINKDGGYGDTPASPSNISTTLLCWAAFALVEQDDSRYSATIKKIEKYLSQEIGDLSQQNIVKKILEIYGKDHTFSVPILTTLAATGRLGEKGWLVVPQLPFELAIFPHSLFRFLKLEVVSYALPALISIGLVKYLKYHHRINLFGWLRKFCKSKVLKILASIQPENGGFLEATPLTGFVLLSLSESDLKNISVAHKCAAFLESSIRKDGSFPIDTNLHTWVTTLAINSLTSGENKKLSENEKAKLTSFLLDQQFRTNHPYTKASPGGWGWTPLPGAVPDADDTSGALIALKRLNSDKNLVLKQVEDGITWLFNLQNNDGGLPTFCRGWGNLPFDQSCPDITAHGLRAFYEWYPFVSSEIQRKIDSSMKKMVEYLKTKQAQNGSWNPLWFGNQHHPQKFNLTYGTAQVIIALRNLPVCNKLLENGEAWLIMAQNSDGSWGGDRSLPGTIEETALALNALSLSSLPDKGQILEKGFNWLIDKTNNGQHFPPSPIGLYFASLWYSEKIYPITFTVAAVENVFLNLPLNDNI